MAIKPGDNVAQANFTSSTFNLTDLNSLSGGSLVGIMNGPMATIIIDNKKWTGTKQAGWVRIANIPAGYRPRANMRGSFQRKTQDYDNHTILAQVTTGGELQLYIPSYLDTMIGQISYFVDVGNGTGYTAIGQNNSILAKNFGYETSSLTFLSGRDDGVGSTPRIEACGRVVIILFDRVSRGVSPHDMDYNYTQVATIPAEFRPAYRTQGSLSRNYESGMDCVVTPGGAFGLRTLPISKTTCSGQIVYFR